MTDVPRVVRNDWSMLQVPELGQWRPALLVSVVIPAYNCQHSLDLTLASLTAQTYPADLLEVIVVDDGSQPPLELPKICPEKTRLVRAAEGASEWGPGHAFQIGVRHSRGAIIQRLDADMVVFPDHVEAHARWHHLVPYAVSLGTKRFVNVTPEASWWPSPEVVAEAGVAGTVDRLFDVARSEPHDHIEKILRQTDELRAGDHLNFRAHVGATVALRRELYDAAGGVRTRLRQGEDTEFGYRLAQAGALFVPERHAHAWHLGRTHMMRHAEQLQRYSQPFLADLMPHPRWLRRAGGSGWAVPLVKVAVDVGGRPLELVRVVVDALLRNDETDLRVCLVGPWDSLVDERMPVLADPALDLRLIAATYRSDPRVRLVDAVPETAFPAPYLLTVPPTVGLAPSAIRRLIEAADRFQVGVVRVLSPSGDGAGLELWRTAALGRAGWVRHSEESLVDAVSAIYGARTLPADAVGVVDLSQVPPRELAKGMVTPVASGKDWWPPATVEVAGVRSLGRATMLVARLSLARGWALARRFVAAVRAGAPLRRR